MVRRPSAANGEKTGLGCTEEVWPWIAQLGRGRGGFYGYDILENLVGCGIHGADRIVPELQMLRIGDEAKFHPEVGFVEAILEPGQARVLRGVRVRPKGDCSAVERPRRRGRAAMLVVTEEWKATYPGATAGILVMRGLCDPTHHPALEARRLEVEDHLRGRFGGMDRAQLVATAPLDAYSAYFKRFKKTYPVLLQLESVVFKHRHIPNFSALVTAMFTAELKSQLLTAGHDFDSLQLPVTLRVADGTESFTLITGAEQGLKAGDMYMSDTAGIISVVVYGPDERTRITPDTRNALFAVYAPPGVDPAAVRANLEDIRDYVLLVAPEATFERLEVFQA